MARKLVAFRLLENIPVPSGIPELVLSYFVGEDLQRFKERAWYYCWCKILLRGNAEVPELKFFSSDSESSEELQSPGVGILNSFEGRPLWQLMLSSGPYEPSDALSDGLPYGRPFRILIRMLGSPPLGIGVERAVQDTLLRLLANRF